MHYVLDQDGTNITGADNGIFTDLAPGSYTVTISDSNGCSVQTLPVSVDEPSAITGSTTIFSNYFGAHISCFGLSDGIIRATSSGGTGLKTYELVEDGTNTTGDANGIYTGLSSGIYSVRVTDANGCTIVTNFVTLIDPVIVSETSSITSDYAGSDVSCNGENDGEITVVGAGGTGTLTYELNEDPTNTTGNLSGVYQNLLTGAYTVTITDFNGCDITTPLITLVDPPVVTSTSVKQSPYGGQDLSCFGAADGMVERQVLDQKALGADHGEGA